MPQLWKTDEYLGTTQWLGSNLESTVHIHVDYDTAMCPVILV